MQFTETELRDLAIEHDRYLARITPVIRARLALRGKSESDIAAYIAALPDEHFLVQLRSTLSGLRTKLG